MGKYIAKFKKFKSRAGEKVLGMAGISYEKVAPKVKEAYDNIARFAHDKDIDFYVENIKKAVDNKDKDLYDMNVKMLKFTLKELGMWKKAGRREINKLRRKLRL